MFPMSQESSDTSVPFVLLRIIGVDHAQRVRCQCNGCTKTIYVAIHMVQLPNYEVECWGSDCYAHELGKSGRQPMEPMYPGMGGRKLTPEERELLLTNRDKLIAKFKAEHEEEIRRREEARLAAEARRAEAVRREEEEWKAEIARIAEAEARAIATMIQPSAQPATPAPKPSPNITPTSFTPFILSRHPLPVEKPPAVDYYQPQPREPMDDPEYREIREEKIKRWKRNGIDLTKPIHYSSLIDNCMLDYSRRKAW